MDTCLGITVLLLHPLWVTLLLLSLSRKEQEGGSSFVLISHFPILASFPRTLT